METTDMHIKRCSIPLAIKSKDPKCHLDGHNKDRLQPVLVKMQRPRNPPPWLVRV